MYIQVSNLLMHPSMYACTHIQLQFYVFGFQLCGWASYILIQEYASPVSWASPSPLLVLGGIVLIRVVGLEGPDLSLA